MKNAPTIEAFDLPRFRMWPDGTIQSIDETPYQWMSDDFMEIVAEDEEDAARIAQEKGYC